MKLNNKKIDLILKLLLYLFPVVIVLINVLSFGDTGSQDFDFIQNFQSLFLTNSNMTPFETTINDFLVWVYNTISASPLVGLVAIYLILYIPAVELLLLIKNCLVFLFKFAEDLLQKGIGVGND